MAELIGGMVPMDDMIAGIRADVLRERDPGGETFISLLDAIERHAALESDALGQYERIAEASGDPVIALVMRLILEDEERHHGLIERIATTLRDTLNWTHSPEALPRLVEGAPVAEDLAPAARELIDAERTGALALRRLARGEQALDGGLASLLLEMMAMDSEKHARLLQFVHARLEERTRAGGGPMDRGANGHPGHHH